MVRGRALGVVDGSFGPGIYRLDPGMSTELMTRCVQAGRPVFAASGNVESKVSMLREIQSAMRLPAHFGHNWDALLDCMTDLSWVGSLGEGPVLIWAGFWYGLDNPSDREEVVTLLGVLGSAVARWWRRGLNFLVLLEDPSVQRTGLGSDLPYIERPSRWENGS
jgi:hypothetical protein